MGKKKRKRTKNKKKGYKLEQLKRKAEKEK